MTHDHEAFSELAASYVLGSLSTSEREAFEVHLATCDTCATDVRAFGLTAGTLAYAVPQVEPSPALRDRVLNSLAGSPRSNTAVEAPSVRRRASHVREAESTSGSARMSLAWLAAAAALVVAAAVGTYAVQLRGRVSDLESELARAILRADASDLRVAQILRNVADAQSSVAVLTAPDLARVDLAGQPVSPAASGRAFWSRSTGLVFTASNLPRLPPGRTYQLWVITAKPASPISAGLLTPDDDGRVTAVFDTPSDLPTPIAMAVTIEAEGGAPAPTGDKYLVSTPD